jgi:flavin-dependent thymidylate synthase
MGMQVLLAGFNVDVGTIEEARSLMAAMAGELPSGARTAADAGDFLSRGVWTPETLSAAYARISRDPAPVPELRERSRREVGAARRSNRRIIFGLGHSSVAEHAVFNFDILGVSRLAVEEIEHHRLCSFTEKSQRYITLGEEAVTPKEITEAGLDGRFGEFVRLQFEDYIHLFERLLQKAERSNPEEVKKKSGRTLLEGAAKEDARYVLPLAVPGQLGMTANARNVERIISRLKVHPLAELRDFAGLLEGAVGGIAPSLIKYSGGAGHLERTREELEEKAAEVFRASKGEGDEEGLPVRLLYCTASGDEVVGAALLFAHSKRPFGDCVEAVRTMSEGQRRELIEISLRRLQCWDPLLRAFEQVRMSFELVISASCFAQLKRHRLATIIAQPYDPALGFTVPPAIREAGEEQRFRKAIARAEKLYSEVAAAAFVAAQYVLTNAHRRRVIFDCNLRELYHVARLRLDRHAQWDIRSVATEMVESARTRLPLSTTMICGKDGFEELHRRLFGESPASGDGRDTDSADA